jgi:GTPase SAR1 family protein
MIIIRSKKKFAVYAILSILLLIILIVSAPELAKNPHFIVFVALLSLALGLPIWRNPRNAVFAMEEYIGLDIAFFQKLRIVIYGAGGTGKTTFIEKTFANRKKTTPQTTGIVTRFYTHPYGESRVRLSITDYEGQKEYLIREQLTKSFYQGINIHILIIMLAAFDVESKINQVIVPPDAQARSSIIIKHLERQLTRLPETVLLELVRHCKGLHTVYVLLNHGNLIMECEEEIALAKKMIQPTIEKIDSIVEKYRHEDETPKPEILFMVIDAKNDCRLIQNEKQNKHVMVGLHLLERILSKEKQINGNI